MTEPSTTAEYGQAKGFAASGVSGVCASQSIMCDQGALWLAMPQAIRLLQAAPLSRGSYRSCRAGRAPDRSS